MAEKPILFSGEMVRAILDGRKTQTRRVIKPQPNIPDANWKFPAWADVPLSPCGRPGDCLWVRETFAPVEPCDWHGRIVECPEVKYWPFHPEDWHLGDRQMGIAYRADGEADDQLIEGGKWRPSIFMPRWASRIMLRVIDVKVQRLWDISEHDMNKEGVASPPEDEPVHWVTPWIKLWDGINGKRGYPWADNPFVWVVEFEVSK